MGSISSPGIGSGLNIAQLVGQLVAAERAPTEQRISRAEADARADLSAFGTVRSALSNLQTALGKLTGATVVQGRKATFDKDGPFKASAGTTAAVGSYKIEVDTIAVAQKRQSAAVASTADQGNGSITLTIGSDSFTVNLTGTNTVNDIRDAINEAVDGEGVRASVVNGDAGSVLVLTATETGLDGAVSVASSGTVSTFAGGIAVTTPAANAKVFIDGIERTSTGNKITDAISGVTLELTKADPGNEFTLTVNPDSDAARSALTGFVTAYNSALTALRTVSAYNAETRTAAALNGDATVRSLATQLRGAVGDAFESLSALGIKSSKDGSLTLDTAKFDAALADNPTAVADAFDKNVTTTLGSALTVRLDAALNGSDGSLNARTKSLDSRLKLLASDRERLDVRMERVEASYRRQFTALDGLVAQLQSTSSFLQQQLAGLL